MKTTLSIFAKLQVLLFLFISQSLIAQNCGVGNEFHEVLKQYNSSTRIQSISPVNGILYIPITIHQVRHTNGTYSKNSSLEPFFHSLVSLNRVFSEVHIQFYVNKNIDYIDNDTYLYPAYNSVAHKQLITNYKNSTTVNVWILDGWSDVTSIGYGGPGGVQLADLTERTVIHEFGHFFTLIHTFDFENGIEKVARTGGNCATAGDGICDTHADPYGLSTSQIIGDVLEHKNCEVISNTKDLSNAMYTPPFDNFMSYYNNACGLKFTPQQFDRMLTSIPVYHSGYNEMQGAGIAGAPTALNIISNVGYAEISWTNSAVSIGTLIEYSKDGGTTWEVMNGVTNNQNKLLLSNVFVGVNYLFRGRHLNSIAYSTSINYSPSNSHPFIPIILAGAPDDFSSIGGVAITNTNLNNQTNLQENYSFNTYTPTPTLFIGGRFNLNLKVKTIDDNNGGSSSGPTYMFVYLDENGDGDFDDIGEVKYQENDFFSSRVLNIPILISSQATPGYKRLRIRSFAQYANSSPTGMYRQGETEDYLIQFVNDVAFTSIATVHNQSNKTIELTWADNTNAYNYIIERSIDGVNFSAVKITTVSTPKLYVDTDIALGQKYFYRIKHVNGALYSSIGEQLVKDIAPTSVAGVYTQSNKTIELTWEDHTNAYNYVIERSIDGINYSIIKTTTTSTPKVYVDTDVIPNQQYSYRIKHATGTIYSSIVDVMTNETNSVLTYCAPISYLGCDLFELTEFAIPSIGFVNNTAGNCGFTSDGYSDFYPTKTINLTAGDSYPYTMKNNDNNVWHDFNMYLDINHNGIFESSEALVNFHTEGTDTPYGAGPFIVPASAMNGHTRLRLRNYVFVDSDPCTEGIYGETEDYKVLISGGKEGIVINPVITNVAANQLTLSWSPKTGTNPTGYTLKISTDGITYSNAITLTSNQTSYTYTGLLSDQRYFIQVVASGLIASDPKTVWTNTLPLITATIDGVQKNTITAYPNPVSGILTIKAYGTASLVNSYGQIIKNENIEEAAYWDMNGFASGIYFLYIQNEDQKQVLKIIKQ
jgi:hypothetical protein